VPSAGGFTSYEQTDNENIQVTDGKNGSATAFSGYFIYRVVVENKTGVDGVSSAGTGCRVFLLRVDLSIRGDTGPIR
jgi:hypothetical protein